MAELYIPNSQRIASTKAEIYVFDDFLNSAECQHLIDLISKNLRNSELTSLNEQDKDFRTNKSCDIDELDSSLAVQIDLRMSRILDFDPEDSEFMQGQFYGIGQQFKAHHDSFSEEELLIHSRGLGQRTYTFMVYLNDVEEGGETFFPSLGLKFSPRKGQALIWNNLDKESAQNPHSLHQGLPVINGEKFIVTKWFRLKKNLPKIETSTKYFIKAHTRLGLKKCAAPEELFHEIAANYHANINKATTEIGSDHLIVSESKLQSKSEIVPIDESLCEKIKASLKPLVETWAQTSLVPTYVYGIRVYRRGAILLRHRDRAATHTIGVLINIDQDVEEDWPLTIEDNDCRDYDILLRPGEMLFYEGTRLQHERSRPLRGSRYANLFCHFTAMNNCTELDRI
ncbi:2OG-Fe(II) oxygenase [Acidovorax sp.]|uniref:prolyl hydroxylase family protein n=1 Tax=Acidovorax sp. TaxID=1872122 RepID=UPI002ACEB961|nr:2OG-Fe(II) oxygenase [Acidovorax sp.]MDZ7865647.1 2OG-Fe(II) oxygenase [Acidovorax sp.]